ncbi:MAG: GNAT family N-acyltransferase [Candidatus Binatia bacterium]
MPKSSRNEDLPETGQVFERKPAVATTTSFDGLTFKVADPQETLRALDLRRQLYTEELGHHGIDEFDQFAHQLVARGADGEIVAALRIVGPDHRPFDLECLVPLSDFLTPDRLPAEIARFCVRRDSRRVQKDHLIHIGMLKLTVAFARKHRLTDFVTLGLPHLLNLYRVAFFRPLRTSCEHPIWGTVVPMRLDLLELEAWCLGSDEPLARLLTEADSPNIIV